MKKLRKNLKYVFKHVRKKINKEAHIYTACIFLTCAKYWKMFLNWDICLAVRTLPHEHQLHNCGCSTVILCVFLYIIWGYFASNITRWDTQVNVSKNKHNHNIKVEVQNEHKHRVCKLNNYNDYISFFLTATNPFYSRNNSNDK